MIDHDATQAAARLPTERVRELLSLTPGPFGGTLVETSMVRDLAADLLDARQERGALAARLAALAGAVRADTLREARAAVIARQDAVDAEAERAGMLPSIYGRLITQDNVRALDALLAGAPSGYVPARVVRAYLAAADGWERETTRWRREYVANLSAQDAAIAAARETMGTARAALDAALAGCP